jgi:CBS domain-containing protein
MPFSSLNAGQIVNASGHNPFCPVPKNASLLDVAEIFVKFGVRRVPVSDGKSITKIITQTSIVSFLSDHVPVYIPSPSSVGAKDGSSVTSLVGSELSSNAGNSRSGSGSTTGCGGAMVASSISSSSYVVPRGLEVFSKTVSQLGISRKPLLITAKLSDPLYTAFKLIIQHNVSAIPILDDRKKLCATLSARDIHGICFNGLNLNLMFSSISQLLAALHHEEINVMNPTISCKESDVISSVVHKMKASKCHRIWIVNDQREVIGVVSLRDVLEAVSTDS